ncbi:hypothetical protein TWF106_011375 [Orbilia oligospora]|uniref:Uncharacterized protein n=1 Tax=Orbilia oligospora TaxID=2813651 RepID=A0A6G1M1G6_ORBOL|nr:hypothetical protein TWF106_011375 [Orbilia oligospora]KAF3241594.1 hypothetical protein TWF192_008889 [Orbilia oligospora]
MSPRSHLLALNEPTYSPHKLPTAHKGGEYMKTGPKTFTKARKIHSPTRTA